MLSNRGGHPYSAFGREDILSIPKHTAAKTPGRGLAASHLRTFLKENASNFTSQTGKTKRIGYPSTPGHGFESIEPQRLFQDKLGNTSLKASTSFQPRQNPLLDKTNKTPFILRTQVPVTPLPVGSSKLNLHDNGGTATPLSSLQLHPSDSMLCGAPPKSVLRPSSTRKSIRLPSKNFETPDARGRKPHWDVSDGDISVDLGSTSGNVLDGAIIIEEDDDEVEYVPPAIPEPAYYPGFDMPDYIQLGAALMNFGRRPPIGMDVPTFDNVVLKADTLQMSSGRNCDFIDEDSPFPVRAKAPIPKIIVPATSRQVPAIKINSRAPTPSVITRPSTRLTGNSSRVVSRMGTNTSASSKASVKSTRPPTNSTQPVQVSKRSTPSSLLSSKTPAAPPRSISKSQLSSNRVPSTNRRPALLQGRKLTPITKSATPRAPVPTEEVIMLGNAEVLDMDMLITLPDIAQEVDSIQE